ncbi:hypothetical protein M3Y99_00765600 [Aphelenchoides fujianensis]|nr:hypothetical protein M3Y99_00765600 [Aphelenchoides fujianensis]
MAAREMNRVEGSGFEEEVFPPGKTRVYRTIYSPLYLEDFLHKPNVRPEPTLEKLTCNLLVYPFASRTLEEMSAKYARAVKNLKRAAPSLNHVDIMGGHALMRENGTAAGLEGELRMLAWGMDALVDAFAASNLTLHSVFVQIFLVFPEEAFEGANFWSAISELFPADTITNGTSAKNVAIFRQLDYVEICLELSATSDFRTVRSLTNLTEGYSEDFTGASRVGGWNVSSFGENFRLPDW